MPCNRNNIDLNHISMRPITVLSIEPHLRESDQKKSQATVVLYYYLFLQSAYRWVYIVQSLLSSFLLLTTKRVNRKINLDV